MLLVELGTFLQTAGDGTLGTDLFLGPLPDTPDVCTALYEYGGFAPEGDIGAGGAIRYEFPRVQVAVRHTSYATGRAKIDTVCDRLCGISNETLSGVYYVGAWPVQSPYLLDEDENGRWIFAVNFDVHKKPSSS